MTLAGRANYYRRIARAYLTPASSHLTFWHETPQANPQARYDELGPYYMRFTQKADYTDDSDSAGVPILNYRGAIGLQYNPIAIAQWGLGNHNLFAETGDASRRAKFLLAAEWLVANLQPNQCGVPVWQHHFDWEYRTTLRAPWHSGLAQGQGVSLLLRAHHETHDARYLVAARHAFISLQVPVDQGGVLFTDEQGDPWIEEYVVAPPTHILNGFIWALWGVYDYHLSTREAEARVLFQRCVGTLLRNLGRYDTGYWSLYEQSQTKLKMLASPFYHRLHIVQLQIMCGMTGEGEFARTAQRWQNYSERRSNRTRALVEKGLFKLLYY
jgi:hypothetical protein